MCDPHKALPLEILQNVDERTNQRRNAKRKGQKPKSHQKLFISHDKNRSIQYKQRLNLSNHQTIKYPIASQNSPYSHKSIPQKKERWPMSTAITPKLKPMPPILLIPNKGKKFRLFQCSKVFICQDTQKKTKI